jgi:DNA-binding MarR family transcriptional regulator
MVMRTTPATDLEDPLLTSMGLFVEAYAGLSAAGERLLATHGLSNQWFDVLVRLLRTPGHRLRMSDLAGQTTLSASGLTRVVDRLVAEGLARREACPSDRRGSFAVLTEAGEEAVLAALPTHVRYLAEVISAAFDGEELETFTNLMRRLRDDVNPEAERASRPAADDPA